MWVTGIYHLFSAEALHPLIPHSEVLATYYMPALSCENRPVNKTGLSFSQYFLKNRCFLHPTFCFSQNLP